MTINAILAALAFSSAPSLGSYEIAQRAGFPSDFGRVFYALIKDGVIARVQSTDVDGASKTTYRLAG